MKNVLQKIQDVNSDKVIAIGLTIWLILNLVQAFFTELAHDEAYYWMYSKHLDWGYFDHPPMIAVLIKIGFFLFGNELGVRLPSILLGVSTLFIIYKLTPRAKTNPTLFLVAVFAIAIAQSHVVGFLAIPDVPLIFFSALFFFVLSKYLQEDSWPAALALGLIASAMLYSKYHAVLVLIFSLPPNLHLLKRTTFYSIPAIVLVCLLPHLFWQIKHHFPTFEYHLVSRTSAYSLIHTWHYIYSQALIAGPLVTIPLFFYAIKSRTENDLEKTLKFNFYGFFIFFFLMTFRGHTEAHWTAVAFIPLIVLAFKEIVKSQPAKRWLYWLSIPSIFLFLLARAALVVQIPTADFRLTREFHNWDIWARQIKETANGRKVVFTNTYQLPSKYRFYTGDFSHSINDLRYRKNQFDIWPFEDSLSNSPIILFGCENATRQMKASTGETYGYEILNDYIAYRNLRVIPNIREINSFASDRVDISVDIVNVGDKPVKFFSTDGPTTSMVAIFANKNGLLDPVHLCDVQESIINPGEKIRYRQKLLLPEFKGEYRCFIGLKNKNSFPGFNTQPIVAKVK